jgi:hypothetical protein
MFPEESSNPICIYAGADGVRDSSPPEQPSVPPAAQKPVAIPPLSGQLPAVQRSRGAGGQSKGQQRGAGRGGRGGQDGQNAPGAA